MRRRRSLPPDAQRDIKTVLGNNPSVVVTTPSPINFKVAKLEKQAKDAGKALEDFFKAHLRGCVPTADSLTSPACKFDMAAGGGGK